MTGHGSIAHFIKPYRDQVHFVNWISVRFYETGCIKRFMKYNIKQVLFEFHYSMKYIWPETKIIKSGSHKYDIQFKFNASYSSTLSLSINIILHNWLMYIYDLIVWLLKHGPGEHSSILNWGHFLLRYSFCHEWIFL